MAMNWQIVFVLALAGIIIYFLLRIRHVMKTMPGATEKMSTIELVKNWQAEKAKEAQYQNDLKARAREAARPEAERILTERYKQDAIREMTADKGSQAKDKLKAGLGLDLDKATSKDNLSYMVGKPLSKGTESHMFSKDNLENMGMNQNNDLFSKERIARMSEGRVSDDKLHKAASNNVNWDGGVRKGLQNENKMSGLNRVLYGDKKGKD